MWRGLLVINVCFCCAIVLLQCEKVNGADCQPKDFHYTFTKCEANGDSWKVAILKEGVTCNGSIPAPVKIQKCDLACPRGRYLDMQTGNCTLCPKGTYSSGDVRVFDNFKHLPPQFSVETFKEFGASNTMKPCTSSSWEPREDGRYLSNTNQGCLGILSYADDFLGDASVEFEYQLTDKYRTVSFKVQNDKCQLYEDASAGTSYLEYTGPRQWKRKKVKLSRGRNILTWTTYVNDDWQKYSDSDSDVRLREITLHGIAYNRECNPCEPGTASDKEGTLFECPSCPANSFSSISRAINCEPCPLYQYSGIGSTSCTPKPPCKLYNFYKHYNPCNENGETALVSTPAQPRRCRDDLPDSVKITAFPPQPATCAPCNKGEKALNNTHCTVCPFSMSPRSGGPGVTVIPPKVSTDACLICTSNTQPVYGVDISRWSRWPYNMFTECDQTFADGSTTCHESNLWHLMGTEVSAGYAMGHRIATSLTLLVGSNTSVTEEDDEEDENSAKFTMTFSLSCKGFCAFDLTLKANEEETGMKTWNTSITNYVYSFSFHPGRLTAFTWTFYKFSFLWQDDYYRDSVSIHSIKITGLRSGAVVDCKQCPLGVKNVKISQQGAECSEATGCSCIPCREGTYLHPMTKQCATCPPGTIVSSDRERSFDNSTNMCRNCGENLVAHKGTLCMSTAHLPTSQFLEMLMPISKNKSVNASSTSQQLPPLPDYTRMGYNVQPLMDQTVTVSSPFFFTSLGSKYYYLFNFTLNNANPAQYPLCVANGTFSSNSPPIRSLVCRAMVIPMGPGKPPVVAQAVSLGEELVAIRMTNSTPQFREEVNTNLTKTTGWNRDKSGYDLHYQFRSFHTSKACPRGRRTTVTLRCISEEGDDENLARAELAPKCPYGSCNGCHFHILWRSVHACPICHPDTYEPVEEECIMGQQRVHFLPPPHCFVGGRKPPERDPVTQRCPLITKTRLIVAGVVTFVCGVLLLTLIYYIRRNKKLEYKYMKLVSAGPGGRDGMDDGAELPGAESCAVMDADEFHESETGRFKVGYHSLGQAAHGSLGSGSAMTRLSLDDDLSHSGVSYGRKGGAANKLLGKIKNLAPIPGSRNGFEVMETVNLTESTDQ